ncbi:S-adenosylmethionine carrier 1, chloroplastic/mitochondrial-like protein, partial [Tanacetum coccineum]
MNQGSFISIRIKAARASGILKEAKDKLEKRMEELTLRLQLKKYMPIKEESNSLKCKGRLDYTLEIYVSDPLRSFITKHVSIARPAPADCTLPLPSKYVGAGNQYRSISHCVGTILKEEGPYAFIKGMGSMLLWIGKGGSIFFGVLERAKFLLAQKGPDPRMVSGQ